MILLYSWRMTFLIYQISNMKNSIRPDLSLFYFTFLFFFFIYPCGAGKNDTNPQFYREKPLYQVRLFCVHLTETCSNTQRRLSLMRLKTNETGVFRMAYRYQSYNRIQSSIHEIDMLVPPYIGNEPSPRMALFHCSSFYPFAYRLLCPL